MRTVYKYEVPLDDTFYVDLPKDSKVLSVGVQNDVPYIWVFVDDENEDSRKVFRLAGTGHPIADYLDLEFIGTFQLRSGNLVFHLFEVL